MSLNQENHVDNWRRYNLAKDQALQDYINANNKEAGRNFITVAFFVFGIPAILVTAGAPSLMAILGAPVGFFIYFTFIEKTSDELAKAQRNARDFEFMGFDDWLLLNPSKIKKSSSKTSLIDNKNIVDSSRVSSTEEVETYEVKPAEKKDSKKSVVKTEKVIKSSGLGNKISKEVKKLPKGSTPTAYQCLKCFYKWNRNPNLRCAMCSDSGPYKPHDGMLG